MPITRSLSSESFSARGCGTALTVIRDIRFVNQLAPGLIQVWRQTRSANKLSLGQSGSLMEELLLFFLLVCIMRPEASDVDGQAMDMQIRLCLSQDRSNPDLQPLIGFAELETVRGLLVQLTALDAILEDLPAVTNDTRPAEGGGKRRKTDHVFATVWDSVVVGIGAEPSEAWHWMLALPLIVTPPQRLSELVPAWRTLSPPSAEVCSQILEKVTKHFVSDNLKSEMSVYCYTALEALLLLEERHTCDREIRRAEWTNVVDKVCSSLEHSQTLSSVFQRGLSFLVNFFSSTLSGSAAALASLQKLLAQPNGGNLTCQLALVGLVNGGSAFSDHARSNVLRSLFRYVRRDAPTPTNSWLRAKLILVLAQRDIDIDRETVFFRSARLAVAPQSCSSSTLDGILNHCSVLAIESQLRDVTNATNFCRHATPCEMDVDDAPRSQHEVVDVPSPANQLFRTSLIHETVFEQIVDKLCQHTDDILEAEVKDWRQSPRPACKHYQKMAFHTAVCLKIVCFLGDLDESHPCSPQLARLEEQLLKLLDRLTGFLDSWTVDDLRVTMQNAGDFNAFVTLVESTSELFSLSTANLLRSQIFTVGSTQGNFSFEHDQVSRGSCNLFSQAYSAFIATNPNLIRALEDLTLSVVGETGLQSKILSLDPPVRRVSPPSLRPRHAYDQVLLSCVDILHAIRDVFSRAAATQGGLGQDHWSSVRLRACLGDGLGRDEYLPPWCVVMTSCYSAAWGSTGDAEEDSALAEIALNCVLDEIEEDDVYFGSLHPETVVAVLQTVTVIVSARAKGRDEGMLEDMRRVDALWSAHALLESPVTQIRRDAAEFAAMQSISRRRPHRALTKRFMDEICLVTQMHLARLLPAVLKTLPDADVPSFATNLLKRSKQPLKGSAKCTKLRLLDPERLFSLGVVVILGLLRRELCVDALKVCVTQEYTNPRTRIMITSFLDVLGNALQYESAAAMVSTYLPILLSEWLQWKAPEEMTKSKEKALERLGTFPAFLFVGKEASIEDLLEGHGNAVLPTLALEAIKMGGG